VKGLVGSLACPNPLNLALLPRMIKRVASVYLIRFDTVQHQAGIKERRNFPLTCFRELRCCEAFTLASLAIQSDLPLPSSPHFLTTTTVYKGVVCGH